MEESCFGAFCRIVFTIVLGITLLIYAIPILACVYDAFRLFAFGEPIE